MRDTKYTRAQVLKMLQDAGIQNPENILNNGKVIRCDADEADYLTVDPVDGEPNFDICITEGGREVAVNMVRATAHELIAILYKRIADLDKLNH